MPSFNFPVTLALLLAALIYTRGWYRLRRTLPNTIPIWRVAAFVAGLLSVWIAIGADSPAPRVSKLVLDPVISANNAMLCLLWSLGYPDQALKWMEAVRLRLETEKMDPRSMCDSFIAISNLHKFCRNSKEVEELSKEAITICDKYDFAAERQWVTFNHG